MPDNLNYYEVKLDNIISHFAQGLKPTDGSEIFSTEWFVYPVKGVVVFKVFTKEIDHD